ncbi:MAG: hypothetical protein ACLQVN_24715 [Bryobacteraceae bacterium]
MVDAMFDQLEYLLDHESQDCPAGCADCERLKAVAAWLLLPFRLPQNSQPSTPADTSAT